MRVYQYLRDDILMRKIRSSDVPANESWCEYHQIIVPTTYRRKVRIAHDYVGGHLGVKMDFR